MYLYRVFDTGVTGLWVRQWHSVQHTVYSHKPHISVNTTEDMTEVRVHAAFTVQDEGEFLKEAQKMIDATQVCASIIFQNTFEK